MAATTRWQGATGIEFDELAFQEDRMNLKTLKGILVAGATVLALAVSATPAKAAILVDFSEGLLSGGTILTNGTDVIGTNIAIGKLELVNGGSDTVTAINALLNFNTVTGTVSITANDPTTTGNWGATLLSGSISSFTWNVAGSGLGNFTAVGPDRKSRQIDDFFGFNINQPWQFSAFEINALPALLSVCNNTATSLDTSVAALSCFTAHSTDVGNVPTPEPGSMLLLGSGLLALGGVLRRRIVR
jgi:hypothetical protein